MENIWFLSMYHYWQQQLLRHQGEVRCQVPEKIIDQRNYAEQSLIHVRWWN